MTKKTASHSKRNDHDNNSSLDSRYGSIGISAVAAALCFKSDVRKPAHASADASDEERHSEMAA
ncbi:MAG TPA: hypothetical protein VH678_33140 [Xanthobacteraceae bacterium]|jgi:hypothetical protein